MCFGGGNSYDPSVNEHPATGTLEQQASQVQTSVKPNTTGVMPNASPAPQVVTPKMNLTGTGLNTPGLM